MMPSTAGSFARENLDRTVAALVASQELVGNRPGAREAATKRLSEAEARLRRFQVAIEAGVDPAALVNAINEAQAARAGPHERSWRTRPRRTC